MIRQIEPWIDHEELELLGEVIRSTQITEGEFTKKFEELTKDLTKSKHAISYSNGSTSLFAILKCLGIGPGDEVIVPNLTFIATATAVILTGAVPIFCDIEEETLGMDPVEAKKLINKNTKAIIPVHLYGNSANIVALKLICDIHKIALIEDAAQGVGVKFKGKHVGTFGIAGVLSYYGNKTITCGEGGIVLTDSDEFRDKIYSFKNHGRLKKGIFTHESIGFNFAFTEMQAAIGVSQMRKLDRIITKKNIIFERYLEKVKNFNFFGPAKDTTSYVPWFTSLKVDNPEKLMNYLEQRGIQSRRFFPPLTSQPCFSNIYSKDINYKISEKIYNSGLSLPSSVNLDIYDQDKVIKALNLYEG
jgi:perosamine synthetase